MSWQHKIIVAYWALSVLLHLCYIGRSMTITKEGAAGTLVVCSVLAWLLLAGAP